MLGPRKPCEDCESCLRQKANYGSLKFIVDNVNPWQAVLLTVSEECGGSFSKKYCCPPDAILFPIQ